MQCPPHAGAAHPLLAGAEWGRARGHLPAGASAGPAGAFRFHRHGRSRHQHRRCAAGSPALSLPPGLLGLGARPRQAPVATILFVDTVDMACWRISILQQSEAILSISVAFVRTTITYHSPLVMVAIGLLGDEADRNQLDARRRPSAVGTAYA